MSYATARICHYMHRGIAFRYFVSQIHLHTPLADEDFSAAWSRDISGLCKQGRIREAIEAFKKLHLLGSRSELYHCACILLGCAARKTLIEGQLVHSYLIQHGIRTHDNYIETKLLNMYVRCGRIEDARQVFEEMPKPNVVFWTTMIGLCAKNGMNREALDYFYEMRRSNVQLDALAVSSVLPACANIGFLEKGREIHQEIIVLGLESDVFVGSSLIDMYVKCGAVETARDLFESLAVRNNVIWTVMISAYARNGQGEEALNLFYRMQNEGVKPTEFTYVVLLPACATLMAIYNGREIHQEALKRGFMNNVFVGSAILDMYVKCKRMNDAQKLFAEMRTPNLVSMNTMLSGYAQHGMMEDAFRIFEKMPQRDVVSWTSMLAGCAQNGNIREAESIFHSMPEQSVISWNAMIAGYAQNERLFECLGLFRQMQVAGFRANCNTFASVLSACSKFAALGMGKQVHAGIIRACLQSNVFMGSALVDMYAKCGNIDEARKVFDDMPCQNVVSWNAMIVGYAAHGQAEMALQFFDKMLQAGRQPNHVTFIGVLNACCHAGLVEEGWKYFTSMTQQFGFSPHLEHYSCMIDLLGRAGHLKEAREFIDNMPIQPNEVILGSFLRACKDHNNIALGEYVAARLIELNLGNAAHYVRLSTWNTATNRQDHPEKERYSIGRL